MALITDIADAIVVALNEHTFDPTFTAVRSYAPAFDLKDMTTLHVTVVPISLASSVIDRGKTTQDDMEIDVGVQQKLSDDVADDITDLDVLMGLVEDIASFVKGAALLDGVNWIRTENDPIYSTEHIKQWRQFTSVLTFTYRVFIR